MERMIFIIFVQLSVTLALLVALFALVLIRGRRGDWLGELAKHRQEVDVKIANLDRAVENYIRQLQNDLAQGFKLQREELGTSFQQQGQMMRDTLTLLGKEMQTHFLRFQESIDKQTASQQARGKEQNELLASHTKYTGDQLKASREEQTSSLASLGKSQQETLQKLGDSQQKMLEAFKINVQDLGSMQVKRFSEQNESLLALRKTTEDSLREMRAMIETKLKILQDENGKKLEEMRVTVDEKLQSSVKDRFDHSFKLISGQLESVQKGLGEMQTLASGVGDLKKVLTNVKTRGNLGEIQLGSILEDILTPDQYVRNANVDPSTQEVVEFAVKLPGRRSDDSPLLLPIDSKFPMEDYQRLQQAYENAGSVTQQELENLGKQFENSVRKSAKDIYTKYIKPPLTTDFALLFVPTEGLYAEVLHRPGLFELVRREYKVVIVGPSNVSAFLSSLQMGFRTLAIERRSSEVWELLGAVKTEFGKFGDVLAAAKKKIMSVGTAIEGAERRTRVIDRKLRKVQELSVDQSRTILGDVLNGIAIDDGEADELVEGEGE